MVYIDKKMDKIKFMYYYIIIYCFFSKVLYEFECYYYFDVCWDFVYCLDCLFCL